MTPYPDHNANIAALKRIEGQVRGVQKMIENRKYCVDILTQISAIKGALGCVETKILKKHLQHCVTDSMRSTSKEDIDQKLNEIFKIIQQIKKCK